jgi:hypothetical protein
MRFEAEVIKPFKGRPSTQIQWRFPTEDLVASRHALFPRAGHGETAGSRLPR